MMESHAATHESHPRHCNGGAFAEANAQSPESFLSQFGLSSFRHGQKEVISTVLAGQDCLCVMPTGGGKSLCYQLPAILMNGLTLVVSPLIALMKDQVDQLQTLGLPVTFVNSTLPVTEQYARLDRMAAGEFRLVYVAPERFRSGRFLEAVRSSGVKLLAVDEAHCISEWGHDFRPDYARLGYFRRLMDNPATLALTATATDRVRRDIIDQLALKNPKTFITGFARPNLFYEVDSPKSERKKPELLVDFLHNTPGSGIIYTSTRKRAQEVGDMIARETRRRAVVYHAGLQLDERRQAQEDFMDGRREIVVATNAFGMGIDKPDVRFVVHYNLPGSLEAYYQEAGRAGRDGKPSRCMMLFHPSDRYIQEFFIESAYPGRENVQAVYDHLCEIEDNPIEMTQDEIKSTLSLPITTDGVGNCEQLLEGAGVLERLMASQNTASVRIDSDLPTLVDMLPKQAKTQRRVLQSVERLVGSRRQEMVPFNLRDLAVADEFDQNSIGHALRELNRLEAFTYVPPFRGRAIRMIHRDLPFEKLEIDFEALEERKALEYEKLNNVIRFAMGGGCRQREILRYFGEENAERCGHCDNCRKHGVSPLPLGEGQGVRGEGQGVRAESSVNQYDAHESIATNPIVEGKVLEAVRIVLSGVARAQARFRCGKNLIAQMLCGSNSAKVKKLRLDQLSTHGLLKHLKQDEVLLLIEALLALGCVQQVDLEQFRPVLEITEFGSEVMKGKAALNGPLPVPDDLLWKIRGQEKAIECKTSDQPQEVDRTQSMKLDSNPDILNSLKHWRAEIADKAGLPRYCILSNDALMELAHRQPSSLDQMLSIKGIGPVTVERYGVALLEILGDNIAEGSEEDAEETKKLVIQDMKSESLSPPSHYWTQRLLQAGFSVEECMAIRGLGREEILEHAKIAGRDVV
jgi:ATP-dependent DNA helicase RecQ